MTAALCGVLAHPDSPATVAAASASTFLRVRKSGECSKLASDVLASWRKKFGNQVADSAEQDGSTSQTSCVGSPIMIRVPSVHSGKGTHVRRDDERHGEPGTSRTCSCRDSRCESVSRSMNEPLALAAMVGDILVEGCT